MTEKRRLSICRHRRRTRWRQAFKRFDRDRVALWLTMVLVALFSVIFLFALVCQDTDLMYRVLPVLIIALRLALNRALKE